MKIQHFLTSLTAIAVLGASQAYAAGELNLYSSRHYDTDERLYTNFEEQTGIKINRIEDDADKLIERIKAEGANSPADVLLTVDAGRLWRADQAGLFQPVESTVLIERIPEHLRQPEGRWFGFSQRGRVIFYDKTKVDPKDIQSYEALVNPKFKGMVCMRSAGNIYSLSLLASIIDAAGAEGAQQWAQGVWDNRARDPQGGDTDQLRAIVSGECAIAIANTYYFARALRTDVKGLSEEDIKKIGLVFPNQADRGTHVNISGAGVVANAPNRENAIKFLEYLASDEAQEYFSAGNDEYPVVEGVELSESVSKLGEFKVDEVNLSVLGENQREAQQIYDRVGFK